MNVEQLERIQVIIQNIHAELQTDPLDTAVISGAVGNLEVLIAEILAYLEKTKPEEAEK